MSKQTSTEQNSQNAQPKEEENSWFGYGFGSWVASKLDNAVTFATDGVNKIGTTLQETFATSSTSETPVTPSEEKTDTPATTTTTENKDIKPAEPNEKGILDSAEESLKSLVGTVIEGSKNIADKEEVKLVKQTLTDLTESTKNATIKLYKDITDGSLLTTGASVWDSLKKSAIDIIQGDDGTQDLGISFQDLFENQNGEVLLFTLRKYATECNDQVSKSSIAPSDKLKELILLVEMELATSKYASDSDTTSSQIVKSLAAAVTIQKITSLARDNATNIENSFTELCNSTSDASELSKHALFFIEKTKAEGYRFLAKLSADAIQHIVKIAEHVLKQQEPTMAIPDDWKLQDFTEQSDVKKQFETMLALVKNFLFLVIQETKEVSHVFSSTAQKINAIVKRKQLLNQDQLKDLDGKTVSCCTDLIVQIEGALSYCHEALNELADVFKFVATKFA